MKTITFEVQARLLEPMLGTVPYNPEMLSNWVQREAQKRGVDPALLQEELATGPVFDPAEKEKTKWDGFHHDEAGIFVYDYLVKGFLKEAANTLDIQLGVKGLRHKTDRFVFPSPRRVYIQRGGVNLLTPDDYLDRSIRAMSGMGQQTFLKRSDIVNLPASLNFTVEVAVPSEFSRDEEEADGRLRFLLDYGKYAGLGEWRTGGYGRFEYDLKRLNGKR